MGKTFKDIKKFDIKRNKEGSRMQTQDMDLRTRVKPVDRKEKGGGKNWKELLVIEEDEEYITDGESDDRSTDEILADRY